MPNIFRRKMMKKTSPKISPEKSEPTGFLLQSAEVDNDPKVNKYQTVQRQSPSIHVETQQLQVGIAQSIGIHRETNEDSLFTLTSNLNTNGRVNNFGLYIIADGMGGHEDGEIASRIAVEKMSSHVISKLLLSTISMTSQQMDHSIQEVLRDGAINAHQAIKHTAKGSGTTLTAALVLGDQLSIAHIGDSRAYLIDPDWRLHLLTHDHSLVKRLEEIGQITTDEASRHPRRNLLYRALGQGDEVEPDVSSFHLFTGQILMLCTDGLWGVVAEAEIIRLLQLFTEPQAACQSLVDAANAAGGPDNISVILIRFPG